MNPAHGIAEVPVLIILPIQVGRADTEESRYAHANAFSVDPEGILMPRLSGDRLSCGTVEDVARR